jgi:ankyrin repeat protein
LVLRDQNNFTAVMHSSAHPEMVSFFRSLPGPRLLAAAQAGDVTTCTTLLDQGVPIDYQDEQGSSALMRACEHGHEAVARLLLQRNPPPLLLLRDKQPRTAVMLASEFDRVRVAKAFFDHLTANPAQRRIDGSLHESRLSAAVLHVSAAASVRLVSTDCVLGLRAQQTQNSVWFRR